MSIGVAIIGSGIFAKEEHLPAVLETPLLALKAIYSRSHASAKSMAESATAALSVDLYADDAPNDQNYAALLQRADVTAVIIALPILTQPRFIHSAIVAGKHVLSEKPIAPDVARARELVEWYRTTVDSSSVVWAVAENFRFHDAFATGRQEIEKLGRVLTVQVRVFSNVKAGGKYFETPWRKVPDYQGGFLLDGGVHYAAAVRLLLGPSDAVTCVSAQTAQLQRHLPPLDTVDAVFKTRLAVTGSFNVSFGTTLSAYEFTVACERGSVAVGRDYVEVRQGDQADGILTRANFPAQGSGVAAEVKAWAEALQHGKPDPRQIPEEAIKDLELLEAMLKSGERDSEPVEIKS
ncbi:MAG: hypothetical protein M1832_003460 [Thelocarpon impressellum]|nr:MAG: hypothetical protein M1832_003460 [Thelocarpon impressellum]